MSKKFNVVMPETNNACLCLQIEREISGDGYKENFIKRIETMVLEYGEIRLLIYYKNFLGWNKEAAMLDVSTSVRFKNNLCKMAMVNPPDSEIARSLVRQESLTGKISIFQENELQDALKWVKS